MKKWIILGIGLVVVLAATITGTMFLTGAFAGAPVTSVEGEVVAKPVEIVEKEEIFYHYMQPEFVVNFRGKERPRALMIEITVASYNEKALAILEKHTPELRNNLLMLMTEYEGAVLATLVGKNDMREGVKNALNALMLKHAGIEAVEDVFFTRFVLQ